MNIKEILAASPVMPVIVANDVTAGVALARALVNGGIRVLEVTLRTPQALDVIRGICNEVPQAIVGAGTITRAGDIDAVLKAGAMFGVSPGHTPSLLCAAAGSGLPFLPGVMTPSDVIAAREAGYAALKLFPAQQAGGIEMLNAMAGPFPDVVFCPTGGVNPENAAQFLALKNVACVGGSWLVPPALVARGEWLAIQSLAVQAAALGNARGPGAATIERANSHCDGKNEQNA
ncbi:bifunctional 4-hydroxy-2-oxoglutarate aldolase/2-dehydro-3-deoxy-phosphogluconate aldolase [Noviherbaspirillum sedimenti]|uniref:2-dehydro-3-deoxy-phosphogluconate aldolase n=1 Tax=Noviherbaspirillum sedimenti TaxID=2320865 RepID=A0A3A3G2B1_9BURK|nr:bifunctional 4-hydroxy-2-oxoglutarate aldolase/2-dehydro-3-deoxy-phosphogluconate aldolase [Noviherbaspirillum sedimenti]RJG01795.1 bifunctional 4-hydroxy-2-oxoglutarate aldolase/2-dehydro-3-deoxy-phosphogluconate aldolase [Noviherbaspirillum sedimenti]